MELHLISNAHLDPVWQWDWEEGVAQALSTFRAAADFCEEFDGYIFNHNEALLYEWVEDYEPALFQRIERLVAAGRWHIMGGWYLQPDMSATSGESILRQMEAGRRYFAEKFGAAPTTAINFDTFGHPQGLVQLLAQNGYDSYIYMRPEENLMDLPAETYRWRGPEGSEVVAHRIWGGYNSFLGRAVEKVADFIAAHPDASGPQVLLWGVGNHGGGPSRKDIRALAALQEELEPKGIRLLHSTPEAFFGALDSERESLPVVARALRPSNVGCYTSQARVKQAHRALENRLYATEKMASVAAAAGLLEYPAEEIAAAEKLLLTAQFHDILPGTSVPAGEQTGLHLLHSGLQRLAAVRARAFFALCAAQPPAAEGEYPILVFNPHPYEVEATLDCEYQLADQNWSENEVYQPTVWQGKDKLPAQTEQEAGNIPLDWRKRVVFRGRLAPLGVTRFSVHHTLGAVPAASAVHQPADGLFCAGGAAVDRSTGLLRQLGGSLAVMRDNEDPWGMNVRAFTQVEGWFRPANEEEAARIMGRPGNACHVIEDGPVRMVVESVLVYKTSSAVLHWRLYKHGGVEVDIRLQWNEKDRMAKWCLHPPFAAEGLLAQECFCHQPAPLDGEEQAGQKWVAAVGQGQMLAVLNNGVHGFSWLEGCLAVSLLRAPAYTAHPIEARETLPAGRFTPRMDQGEHLFQFRLLQGAQDELETQLDAEALLFNERPYALPLFPPGTGSACVAPLVMRDKTVVLSSLRAGEGGGLVARLYNATGEARTTTLQTPAGGIEVVFGPWQVKTVEIPG